MQRTALVWMAAIASLALTGCPPPYPKCTGDKECKDHSEVCVQGQCQECAVDANCKPGFVCQTGRCLPKPECTADASCPGGTKCKAGKCAPECAQDNECGAGKCRSGRCVENACTTPSDCPGGQDCQAGVCAPKVAEACKWEPLRFGFNDYALAPEMRSALDHVADCIKKAGVKKVTLEGHADERGTEEYNLQLSNRRASAVRKYLSDLGVPAAKLDSVGFGENRPLVDAHTEEAWSTNRRVEFKTGK